MRREELIVQLADAWDLEGRSGAVEPKDVGELLRSYFLYPRMLAAAWMILHYEDSLSCGHWPQSLQGVETSRGGAFHYGPEEIPGQYAAMISSRIALCGVGGRKDGKLCWRYYEQQPQPPDQEPSGVFTPSPEQCDQINNALHYCATWRERHCPYGDWLHRNDARRNKRKLTREMTLKA